MNATTIAFGVGIFVSFLAGVFVGAVMARMFFRLGAGTVWRASGKEGNPAEPPSAPQIEQDRTD